MFWAAKEVAKVNRALGKVPEYQKDWVFERDPIIARFHIRKAYLYKLQEIRRNVQLEDFCHVMLWLESLVKEEDQAEVKLIVLGLLAR